MDAHERVGAPRKWELSLFIPMDLVRVSPCHWSSVDCIMRVKIAEAGGGETQRLGV